MSQNHELCNTLQNTWRRIGIRLSIEYMTGLRGALATMERSSTITQIVAKLMALTHHRGEGATVPGHLPTQSSANTLKRII